MNITVHTFPVHDPPRRPRYGESIPGVVINISLDQAPTLLSRIGLPHDVAIAAAARTEEHRRGQHTYGNMRRDCPLCR